MYCHVFLGTQCSRGSVHWLDLTVAVTGAKPLPPSSLNVTYLGSDCVVIEWAPPFSEGDSPLLHYRLEKRDSGRAAWDHLTDLPPTVTECQLDNMAADKTYYLRVRAANQHGLSEPRDLEQPVRIKGDKRGDAFVRDILPRDAR